MYEAQLYSKYDVVVFCYELLCTYMIIICIFIQHSAFNVILLAVITPVAMKVLNTLQATISIHACICVFICCMV